MHLRIEQGDSSISNKIENNLLEDLRRTSDQAENSGFTLVARSNGDDIIGGLTAMSSYGWLLIKTVWVLEAERNNGIGAKLVQEAELRAKQLGCHAAWLDTSSPIAWNFYQRIGYKEFAKLENATGQFPESHQRWFLKKIL